jgi:hypothetical protein
MRRYPACTPNRTRTAAVSHPYCSRALAVLKSQATLVFGFARGRRDQPFSLARSGVEIASQAEYAGSIPVIGSTLTTGGSVSVVSPVQAGTYAVPTVAPGLSRLGSARRARIVGT